MSFGFRGSRRTDKRALLKSRLWSLTARLEFRSLSWSRLQMESVQQREVAFYCQPRELPCLVIPGFFQRTRRARSCKVNSPTELPASDAPLMHSCAQSTRAPPLRFSRQLLDHRIKQKKQMPRAAWKLSSLGRISGRLLLGVHCRPCRRHPMDARARTSNSGCGPLKQGSR